jgi:hypothetical protein
MTGFEEIVPAEPSRQPESGDPVPIFTTGLYILPAGEQQLSRNDGRIG